jgi:hypothetical protein
MYTKPTILGGTGVAMLPNTGNNRVLFVAAVSLLVVGVIVFAASLVSDLKSRRAAK